ncbi:MAG TPA: hypothetical protein VHX66_12235 [Solirubrobacteraceae bacterium]|nr:hypothetical protein [Solirubrobacteraceae bacterium]
MTEQATSTSENVECIAAEVLRDLYWAFAGEPPRALRAYRDEDALLLLLRFEASRDAEPDVAFMALPSMVAEAVTHRTGRVLVPRDASVCASSGLAVLGFALLDAASGALRPLTGDDLREAPSPPRRPELRVAA